MAVIKAVPRFEERADYFNIEGFERINLIRTGVPAAALLDLTSHLRLPQEKVLVMLRAPKSTTARKASQNEPLNPDLTERFLGVTRLIGMVQQAIEQDGDPEDFDAAQWLGAWLQTPLAALGNDVPASYMDTIEGQKIVGRLLEQALHGAYA